MKKVMKRSGCDDVSTVKRGNEVNIKCKDWHRSDVVGVFFV